MKKLRILFAILTYLICNEVTYFVGGFAEMIFGVAEDNLIKVIVIMPFGIALYFFYKNFNLVYNKQMDLIENRVIFKRFLEAQLKNMKENMSEEDRKRIDSKGLASFLVILLSIMIVIMFFASGTYLQIANIFSNPNNLSSWIFILNFIIFVYIFSRKVEEKKEENRV